MPEAFGCGSVTAGYPDDALPDPTLNRRLKFGICHGSAMTMVVGVGVSNVNFGIAFDDWPAIYSSRSYGVETVGASNFIVRSVLVFQQAS